MNSLLAKLSDEDVLMVLGMLIGIFLVIAGGTYRGTGAPTSQAETVILDE